MVRCSSENEGIQVFEREVWNEPQCALVVELCRYFAQYLYRSAYDADYGNPASLPTTGVIPAGTTFYDYGIRAYRAAASDLIEFGFAAESVYETELCTLKLASDRFALECPPELSHSNFSHFGSTFSTLFKTYDQNGKLGHPNTLQRIFELLPAAGLLNEQYGFYEWSEEAVSYVHPRRWKGFQYPESDVLWSVNVLDWYVEEAASQWHSST